MNEIIRELYTIEERASQITEQTKQKRQELQKQEKEQEEQITAELKAEMDGRLVLLKNGMEEQAKLEIEKVIQKNEAVLAELNQEYDGNYEKKAQEILARITEV